MRFTSATRRSTGLTATTDALAPVASALLVLAGLASAAIAAAPREPALTPDGWGALRIGMQERAPIRRFGLKPPA
jgi:hypothetical protein